MQVTQTIPILRIFDVAKARQFYLDYLGFHVDWEHRFEPAHDCLPGGSWKSPTLSATACDSTRT